MILKVCIGSACHVKGSYDVIEVIKNILRREGLEDRVELKACFCLNSCLEGVSVSIEGRDEVIQIHRNTAIETLERLILEGIV